MKEIKANYSLDLLLAMTERDRSGRGFVCPVCGSGTGKNGTGMTAGTKNPNFYKCWNCCFDGYIFDIIAAVYHCSSAREKIQKAGELLHRDFLQNGTDWPERKPAGKAGAANVNDKNHVETIQKPYKNNIEPMQKLSAEAGNVRAFMLLSHRNLKDRKKGLDYLQRRGISERTALRYGLGWAASYGDGMNTPAVIIPTGQ